jgi:hypothetical protein
MTVPVPEGNSPLSLALQRRLGRDKASRLCPYSSDVDLFGYGESVIRYSGANGRYSGASGTNFLARAGTLTFPTEFFTAFRAPRALLRR